LAFHLEDNDPLLMFIGALDVSLKSTYEQLHKDNVIVSAYDSFQQLEKHLFSSFKLTVPMVETDSFGPAISILVI
jgi:hypothetical protein